MTVSTSVIGCVASNAWSYDGRNGPSIGLGLATSPIFLTVISTMGRGELSPVHYWAHSFIRTLTTRFESSFIPFLVDRKEMVPGQTAHQALLSAFSSLIWLLWPFHTGSYFSNCRVLIRVRFGLLIESNGEGEDWLKDVGVQHDIGSSSFLGTDRDNLIVFGPK